MKIRTNVVILVVVILLLPALGAAKMVGVDLQGRFWKIDQATGAGTSLGYSGFDWLNCLARDSKGDFYSCAGTTYANDKLLKISPYTGQATAVATLSHPYVWWSIYIYGLAFGYNDKLYAVLDGRISVEEGDQYLCSLNTTTGVLSYIGIMGSYGEITSIAFPPNSGTLYGWHVTQGLVTIDTTNGAVTVVNPSAGVPGRIGGLAFTLSGDLYGVGDNLYRIDPATGLCTLVGAGGYSDLRGLEFLPQNLPGNLIGVTRANGPQGKIPVVKIDETTGAGGPINISAYGLQALARDGAGNLYSLSGNQVVKINPVTGVATWVCAITHPEVIIDAYGLAFSPAGVLYAYLFYQGPGIGGDYDLFTIDLGTGIAMPQGLGWEFGLRSLAFDSEGTLYGWDSVDGLVTISTTGYAIKTDVNAAVGNPHNINALVFAPDGVLYGAGDALYRINKTTGVATLVGSGDYSGVEGLEYVELGELVGVSDELPDYPVFKINAATGVGVTVGYSGNFLDCLARDSKGTLYAGNERKLFKIDPLTGEAATVVSLTDSNPDLDTMRLSGLAFSGADKLFALVDIYWTSEPDQYLCTIDINTGVISKIGFPVSGGWFPQITSIAFSPGGILYGWHYSLGLVAINPTTAAVTDVNPSVSGPENISIVFGPGGKLYGAGNSLYRIDPATGVCTLVGSGGYSNIRGLEYLGPRARARISPVLFLLLSD